MEFRINKDKIELIDNETLVGEIGFSYIDESIISIDHTFVNESYRGQGIASKLMIKAIEYAKENNLKIKPVCSYAVSFLNKNIEYQNIVAKSHQ